MTGNKTAPTDVSAASCEGDFCVLGFAPRKGDISLYLMAGFEGREALLARLGRHKTGKACLYLRKLADIDLAVLDELIKGSVAATLDRYGSA
ncbi:MAG: hypothetical protein JWP72_1635 [Massilia sp.]|nr:hypothetical protein [Massilia sp.]MDB5791617.1 hypothetical protein [Massilia sp.]